MNEQNYFLTIAIPTYNRAFFLGRALDSVLNQPHEGVEILVSDNASEDDTELVVKEHMPLGDIKYIKNPVNVGPDANFLQCYEQASGKFVLLLGSDDVMVDGGIESIKNFISEYPDCKEIFLNHAFFENGYTGTSCFKSIHMPDCGNFVTCDKKEFIKLTQRQITFMSCFMISSEAYKTVADPQKYMGTYFIHTCITLEATSAADAKLGVIGKVCVAQDTTCGNSEVDKELSSSFKIFGQGMNYTFCKVAPTFNYNKLQLRKLYVRGLCLGWRRTIIKLKCVGNSEWKKEYKKYGKPVLKQHPIAYIRLMPYLIAPKWLAKWLYNTLRPIIKKIKGES